jgi:DNA-binding IclR family transcriptional regulator
MIRAVGRALAIFDAYDNDHLSLSLQDIAERIRMPKTTAFRLVNTLERAGFLVRMDNQQYCLSLKMARLGGLVRSTLSVREIARAVMLEVNEQTKETVTLNAAFGNERMVLEVVDTPSPLMSMARLGQHMPMLLGAASRILLAYMEPQELEEVLKVNTAGVDNFDRAAVDRELGRARRQGYAISRGTRVAGLTAIAVPIFDINNRVPYCLAVTGPSIRIDPRDLELADIMMAAGRDISNRLGASPEHGIDMKLLMSDKSMDRDEAPAKKKPAAKKPPAKKKPAAKKVLAAA